MKKYTLITILSLIGSILMDAETIPAKPDKYFNDTANLVTTEQAHDLNEKLAQFERDTSNQFIVYTAPYMDTNSDAADYTQRIAQSWHVGQAGKNNGLVLFVFMKTANGHGHIHAQVGYGLEGAIPDITAFGITQKMSPYFKNKDYYNGLNKGIDSFMLAAKGEYKGTGKTKAETSNISYTEIGVISGITLFLFLIIVVGVLWYSNWKEKRDEEEQEEKLRQIRTLYRKKYKPTPKWAASGVVSRKSAPSTPKRPDSNGSSYSASSYSDSGSSYDSGSSSSSDSGFSSGGGDFGGGGGGSDF